MRRRLLLLFALAAATAAEEGPVEIRIDAARRLQRIDGFGSSGQAGFAHFERGNFDDVTPPKVTWATTPAQRQALIETAFRELGVSHVRFWIVPLGIEWRNDNHDPEVIDWDAFQWDGFSRRPTARHQRGNRINGIEEWGPFLKEAVALGLENWIPTVGGFPPWLRKLFDDRDEARFAEYAEWAAVHLLYLKKEHGLEAPYWSLRNEPDNLGWTDPGFWRRLIVTTGERFRREGLATRLVFPDYMNVHNGVKLAEVVLQDAEVRKYVGALAYHHYASSGDGPQPFLRVADDAELADRGGPYESLTKGARAMAALGRKYGLPAWQTETGYYIRATKGMPEWEIGRARANEIYYELVSGSSAVQAMLLMAVDSIDPRHQHTNRNEGHCLVLKSDGRDVVSWEVTRDTGAVVAHYARYVRPGDHRVALACPDPLLRATAFVARDGKRCVAVVVNNAPAPRRVLFRLAGLPFRPRGAAGLLTDAERMLVAHPLAGEGDGYEAMLPARSLTTLVWSADELGSLAPPPDKLKGN